MLYLFNCKKVDEKSSAGWRYSCPNRSVIFTLIWACGFLGMALKR